MKTTKAYIEEAKIKLGIVSDYALAKKIGITKQTMSGYQSGTRIMDNYTAAKLAEALEINPLEVISAASAEREKDDKKREFWQKLARTSAAALVTIPLVFSGLDYEDNYFDFNSLYIMRNHDGCAGHCVWLYKQHPRCKDWQPVFPLTYPRAGVKNLCSAVISSAAREISVWRPLARVAAWGVALGALVVTDQAAGRPCASGLRQVLASVP